MSLTKKLISFLHRVFNKDPLPFLALRIGCDGTGLTWTVSDGVLGITPIGGTAAPLSIDLWKYSVASLAAFLTAQPGYTVPYTDTSGLSLLSAQILIEGAGDISQSNGDHLFAYTSVLWSYMATNAAELQEARTQIGNMVQQMNTVTASGSWLDCLGAYYGVVRQIGEADALYGPRIIATVIRPLGNNVAIEAALQVINGGLPATVIDYDTPINHSYGLFDVALEINLDLLAAVAYATLMVSVTGTINSMRDAGTFLRELQMIVRIETDAWFGAAVITGDTVWLYPE